MHIETKIQRTKRLLLEFLVCGLIGLVGITIPVVGMLAGY